MQITWTGTTLYDDYFDGLPLAFQVTLFPDGRVRWKFFDMLYEGYDGDLFSGLYDAEGDAEFEVPGGSTSFSGANVNKAFEFNPVQPAITEVVWDTNDASIPTEDDNDREYPLPFTFPFFGRQITRLGVNTNGLVELLEAGESCVECDDYETHADGDHVTDQIDALFAANDDLVTGVLIEGDTGGVQITWIGTSFNDYDFSGLPLAFQVTLFPDGRVRWKFFDMHYEGYDGDLFSGLYDADGGLEAEVAGGSTSFQGRGVQRAFQFSPADISIADLALTKTDTPDPAAVGQEITYTLVVTNNGPDTAANVHLVDPLPAGTAYVSSIPSQGSCTVGSVQCSLGNLANDASATVTIVARRTQPGLLTNTATVSSGAFDPALDNNTASTTTASPNALAVVSAAAPARVIYAFRTWTFQVATFADPDAGETHIASINWGDGTPPTAGVVNQTAGTVTGSHRYAAAGTYTVVVTVTDNRGASGSGSFQLIVRPHPRLR